jgi:hypothetical protein
VLINGFKCLFLSGWFRPKKQAVVALGEKWGQHTLDVSDRACRVVLSFG